MRIKPTASIRGIRPEIVVALMVAQNVSGETITVTSGTDGKHSFGSLHYVGSAVDIRLVSDSQSFCTILRERLGPEYDVVLEPTHIHIEYQPKGPK